MIAGVRVERFGPGQHVWAPCPADIVLVRGTGRVGDLIRFVQRLRFRTPDERPYAYWSHVALVASRSGRIIEVLDCGVAAQHLAKYRGVEYHYVHIAASDADRRAVVAYAEACVGQRYGRLSFLALGVAALMGTRLRWPDRGQQSCAAFVARALTCTRASFPRAPLDMMPADLAKYYGVTP